MGHIVLGLPIYPVGGIDTYHNTIATEQTTNQFILMISHRDFHRSHDSWLRLSIYHGEFRTPFRNAPSIFDIQ
jgi:hypothetical protein